MLFAPDATVYLPVPHVQQRQQSDCLVACAWMICRYWGKSLTYATVSAVLATDPDFGTPFPNLASLRRYRLRVQLDSGTLESLYHNLQNGRPIIAAVQTAELPYWQNAVSQHAVVVVGMTSTQVLLNDPAVESAPVGIAIGDFDLAWLAQDERFALISPA